MSVRHYQPGDREAVRRICIETGLKGNLDKLFSDTELFADLWLDPYLKGEPESCLVAIVDDEVVGYLVASQRPGFRLRSLRILFPILAKLAWRTLTVRYLGTPSQQFAGWLLSKSWREAPRTPKNTPSFHYNVSENARGARALGDELIAAFCDEARDKGYEKFYIQVFASSKDRPLPFYLRVGFEIYDVRATTVLQYPAVLATLTRPVPVVHKWGVHKVEPPLPVQVYDDSPARWNSQAWPADRFGLTPMERSHIGVWAPSQFTPGPQCLAEIVRLVRRGTLRAAMADGLTFALLDPHSGPHFWHDTHPHLNKSLAQKDKFPR